MGGSTSGFSVVRDLAEAPVSRLRREIFTDVASGSGQCR